MFVGLSKRGFELDLLRLERAQYSRSRQFSNVAPSLEIASDETGDTRSEERMKRKRKREVVSPEVKARQREYSRQYRLAHKEATLERERLFRVQNRELLRERQRQHYIKKMTNSNNYVPRKNKSWKDPEKVREFLESVQEQLHISEPTDWYRISRLQIVEVGGKGLLTTFGNLGAALTLAYPNIDWDEAKFSFRGKKSGQRWLRVMLEKILPKNEGEEKPEIFEDFLHPELPWDDRNNLKMELDIWLPKYNLGLEYQGEQHYYDIHSAFGPSGTSALYTARDMQKKNLCKEKGITLAIIPYWWDGNHESLQATLHLLRPDLFPSNGYPEIPTDPPTTPTRTSSKVLILDCDQDGQDSFTGNQQIYAFLMHGREWHAEQDPTGWHMSEKLDGIRAFWDGSKFYSKPGKRLPVPEEFAKSLPPVPLDGELWAGYESFTSLTPIFKTSHNLDNQEKMAKLWENIKFCAFDAPMNSGNYSSRHAALVEMVRDCDPHITVVPYETCLGLQHLQDTLKAVTRRKGEGLMLYNPDAPYTSGRTNLLLKVKAYIEEDVKFIKCNTNSYSFICEQRNGATCIVKCNGWDYENAPEPGTVLSIKHIGYHKKSQKMKYPFLLKVRPDLAWE